MRRWKQFYLPIAGLLVIGVVITGFCYWWYGPNFGRTFMAQFLATVFGVAFTGMATFFIWRYQQRARRFQHREQLISDLKFEVRENIKRQRDVEMNVVEKKQPDHWYTWGEVGKQLRTVAIKEIQKPENLVILGAPEFEGVIDFVLSMIKQYNTVLDKANSDIADKCFAGNATTEAMRKKTLHFVSEPVFGVVKSILPRFSSELDNLLH